MIRASRLLVLAAVLLVAACGTGAQEPTDPQQPVDDGDYIAGGQGYEYSSVDKTYTELDFLDDGATLAASPSPTIVENRDGFTSRSQFPYCRCGRGTSNSPYRLVLSRVTQLSNGASSRACYRIVAAADCGALDASSRTGMCCNEVERQLHKIHVEADPRCRGSVRSVSLNGWSGKAWQWEDSLGPSASLKISNLGLNNTQALATEVCFTLAAPCASIQDLCFNEPSCRYALFSAAGVNADGGYCCMIGNLAINGTSSGGGSPPPPGASGSTPAPPSPPPASPPPPSPPPPSQPPPSPPPPSPPPSPPPPSPPPPSLPPPSPPPPSPPPPSPPPPPPPPSPPPPSPPPPSPPPPSPPPRCEVCAYIALVDPENNAPFPYAFSADECDSYAQTLIDDITAQAGDAGATIVTPFAKVDCQERLIKVCGEFFSNEEGALIQDWIGEQVSVWNDMVTGGQCPAYLSGYSVVTAVGGDGSDVNSLPMSCLNAFKSTACAPETVDFPKCQCTTKAFATPFAVKPMMSEMAGPSKDTTSYCFELAVVAPANPGSACGKTSTVNKAEFFADDTKRRQIKSIGIKPAGAAGYKWVAPSWGAVGDQTLKVTLGWSTAQAAGGRICLELYNTTSLDDFCMGAAMDTCWLNLFDTTRNCCPLYTSSLV